MKANKIYTFTIEISNLNSSKRIKWIEVANLKASSLFFFFFDSVELGRWKGRFAPNPGVSISVVDVCELGEAGERDQPGSTHQLVGVSSLLTRSPVNWEKRNCFSPLSRPLERTSRGLFSCFVLFTVLDWTHHDVEIIDYRCEDCRLPVFGSSVTILNLDLFSSSETGVNSEIRCRKKHFSDWARCQKAIGGIYFTKK